MHGQISKIIARSIPFIFLTTTTNFQLFRFSFPFPFSVSSVSTCPDYHDRRVGYSNLVPEACEDTFIYTNRKSKEVKVDYGFNDFKWPVFVDSGEVEWGRAVVPPPPLRPQVKISGPCPPNWMTI